MTMVSRKFSTPRRNGSRLVGNLVMIIIAVCIIGWMQSLAQTAHALDAEGRTTTGILTAITRGLGKRGDATELTYTYQVGNQTYTHQNTAASTPFRNAQVGDCLTVTYLPDNPQVARSQWSTELGSYPRIIQVIQGLFCVVILVMVVDIIRRLAG